MVTGQPVERKLGVRIDCNPRNHTSFLHTELLERVELETREWVDHLSKRTRKRRSTVVQLTRFMSRFKSANAMNIGIVGELKANIGHFRYVHTLEWNQTCWIWSSTSQCEKAWYHWGKINTKWATVRSYGWSKQLKAQTIFAFSSNDDKAEAMAGNNREQKPYYQLHKHTKALEKKNGLLGLFPVAHSCSK